MNIQNPLWNINTKNNARIILNLKTNTDMNINMILDDLKQTPGYI